MMLIGLHKEWCKKGKLPSMGLCFSFSLDADKEDLEYLRLFEPDKKRKRSLYDRYWAFGKPKGDLFQIVAEYTPLRQTIVLLICAMKGELK